MFKYVRKQRCNDNSVSPLKDNNTGVLHVSEVEKARILNECFARNFTTDDGNIPQAESRVPEGVGINSANFSPFKIKQIIKKIKPKKSHTPDGIPAVFFKKLDNQLCAPLSVLFEMSFDRSEIPNIWKLADVVPVFKKGVSNDPNNYRPVSLTSISCKIMEMCIIDSLLDYLRVRRLISRQQHGFLAKKSTCTQLLECINDWSLSLSARKSVDVIYIDFRKAFDSVSHQKLINKLETFGISGNLLSWLSVFLSNRQQRVIIGSHMSSYVDVRSGVPQGSCLGPLLFVLYINDLPDVIKNVTCKLFADDVKIYDVVSEENSGHDNITESLRRLCEWSARWQLVISIRKCSVLHLGNRNPNLRYLINDVILPEETLVCDLGVHISSDLKFSEHCKKNCCKSE